MDKLKNAKYFNKLDLIWEYNNITIYKSKKEINDKRLFEPKVMYFGLYNLPGIFQRMMNSIFIFQELLHKEVL